MSDHKLEDMVILSGIIGAEGLAVGVARLVDRNRIKVRKRIIKPEYVPYEIKRFKEARSRSIRQLEDALSKVLYREHKIIIESHIMLVKDQVLTDLVLHRVKHDHVNPAWAVTRVFEEAQKPLDELDEEYFRERKADLQHIMRRLIQNLRGLEEEDLDAIDKAVIVVTHDLSPADMAQINREFVMGIITDIGGSTSHTSILARGMNIPAMVGVEEATEVIKTGDTLILDAMNGQVIINPPPEIFEEYQEKIALSGKEQIELLKFKDLPSVTKDNHQVTLSANIELPEEIPVMLQHGVHTIGLLRSEFLYLTSITSIPTEQDQYLVYRHALEQVGPGNKVTIRTIDVGADKILPGQLLQRETNPAMGERAIRFSLKRLDIFKNQLRALLRASVHGNLQIMFPMISGLGELRQAKAIVEQVKDELKKEGCPFDDDVKIGIMVEVPSAAMIADVLAQHADFFSIGTNDLIQYMLAVDRGNEHVNYLYTPLHPAILRMISEVVQKGHAAGIPVSMCGEMAGEVHFTVLLIGLGIDELSMPVSSVLKIKRFMRNINYKEAQKFAKNILSLGCSEDVTNFLHEQMSSRYPTLFPGDYWKHHK